MKTILKSIIITVLFVFSQQIVFSQINKSELVITEKGINLEDAKKKIANGEKYVIRMKIPENKLVEFNDLVYGKIKIEVEYFK